MVTVYFDLTKDSENKAVKPRLVISFTIPGLCISNKCLVESRVLLERCDEESAVGVIIAD